MTQVTQRQQLFTRASGGATLSLVVEKTVVVQGEEFAAQIFLDKDKSDPTHAYVSLSFAPDELEIIDVGPTHQRIELGPIEQSVHLGEVRFRALKPADNSQIEFSSETWVTGVDNLNLVRRTIGAEVDIRP